MMKSKTYILVAITLLMFGALGLQAKVNVTSKLKDPKLVSENENWALVSNGGTHDFDATTKYHSSWHNTFTLTQTVPGLEAGYYQVSIQVANSVKSSNVSLQATSDTNTSVAAHPKYTTHGSFSDMATWWTADSVATVNTNLNRIHTTVKVEQGKNLKIVFKQESAVESIVYGNVELWKLTDVEGANAIAFETKYNPMLDMDISTSRYMQRFQYMRDGEVEGGEERLKKTISGLPNGFYNVTFNGAAIFSSGEGFEGATGDGLTVFFANDSTVNVTVIDKSAVAANCFRDYTVTNVPVTDGTLNVGCRNLKIGANWFVGTIKGIEYNIARSIRRTTASGKYGTICLPYDATAQGAEVFSATVNGNKVELSPVSDMKAGVPYIYKATASEQVFSYASDKANHIVNEPVANGVLKGVFNDAPAPVGSYVMQTLKGNQQFYIVEKEKQPVVSTYKAYIEVEKTESDAQAKADVLNIGFADDNATGVSEIDAVGALISGNAEIYGINGSKRQQLIKGINIVNGVKFIVR